MASPEMSREHAGIRFNRFPKRGREAPPSRRAAPPAPASARSAGSPAAPFASGRPRDHGHDPAASGFRRRGARRAVAPPLPTCSAPMVATMSVSPARCALSSKLTRRPSPSASRVVLRRCAKWMRGPMRRTNATGSKSARTPRDPVQKVAPFAGLGTASSTDVVAQRRHHPRQAQEREGRIVGVAAQAQAQVLGDGDDLLEEHDQVAAQVVRPHPA
jgi:hypothetical protein